MWARNDRPPIVGSSLYSTTTSSPVTHYYTPRTTTIEHPRSNLYSGSPDPYGRPSIGSITPLTTSYQGPRRSTTHVSGYQPSSTVSYSQPYYQHPPPVTYISPQVQPSNYISASPVNYISAHPASNYTSGQPASHNPGQPLSYRASGTVNYSQPRYTGNYVSGQPIQANPINRPVSNTRVEDLSHTSAYHPSNTSSAVPSHVGHLNQVQPPYPRAPVNLENSNPPALPSLISPLYENSAEELSEKMSESHPTAPPSAAHSYIPPTTTEPAEPKLLTVFDPPEAKISFSCNYRVAENHCLHSTTTYNKGWYNIVVGRRGADVSFSISNSHEVKGTFQLDLTDMISGETFCLLGFEDVKLRSDRMAMRVQNQENPQNGRQHEMDVTLMLSRTHPVTLYQGVFSLKMGDGRDITPYNQEFTFLVLANPWHQADEVFMENENERYEYVIEDFGTVAIGSPFGGLSHRNWMYSQFHPTIIKGTLELLKSIPEEERTDMVKLTRALSLRVNGQSGSGLILGSWDDSDYNKSGINPSAWAGSLHVFDEFLKNEFKPVKWGQCWVFAGCLVTMCRALGIPARCVTCFASAHSSNGKAVVERFYDSQGYMLRDELSDSVWNFHVWVEVHLKRPDMDRKLGATYSGWQAIDGTPQLISDGSFQMGPASVSAVNQLSKGLPWAEDDPIIGEQMKVLSSLLYDTEYLYAEVNAVEYFYHLKPGFFESSIPKEVTREELRSMCDLKEVNSLSIGKEIVTKGLRSLHFHDIRGSYRETNPNNMDRNRFEILKMVPLSVRKLLSMGMNSKPKLGENIVLHLHGLSGFETSHLFKNCTLYVVVVGLDHVGEKIGKPIYEFSGSDLDLLSYSKPINIPLQDTLHLLKEDFVYEVSGSIILADGQSFQFSQEFDHEWPKVELKLNSETLVLGKECRFTASFQNPLPIPLSKVIFRMVSSSLAPMGTGSVLTSIPFDSTIEPYAFVRTHLVARPTMLGSGKAVCSFSSDEVCQAIGGVLSFDVI